MPKGERTIQLGRLCSNVRKYSKTKNAPSPISSSADRVGPGRTPSALSSPPGREMSVTPESGETTDAHKKNHLSHTEPEIMSTPMALQLDKTHWSDDPWWLKPEWAKQADRDLEGVQGAFAYLATVFTRDWFQSIPKGGWIYNIFLREMLYGHSTDGLHYALQLSDALERLKSTDGVSGVVRRLKTVSGESIAASMELHIGDVFYCGGYRVKFPVPSGSNGKTPDIIAEGNGASLAIECKYLWEAERTMRVREAFSRCGITLMDIGGPQHVAVNFRFNNASVRLLELLAKKYDTDSELVNEFLGNLPSRIGEIISRGRIPLWLFHRLGIGYLRKAEHGTGAIISHPESPVPIIQKIISNGIARAAAQIAAGTDPGLLVIFAPTVPSGPGLGPTINDLFESNEALYEKVMAVLLLPQQYWGHWIQPSLVVNNRGHYRWDDFKASIVVRQRWNPRVL